MKRVEALSELRRYIGWMPVSDERGAMLDLVGVLEQDIDPSESYDGPLPYQFKRMLDHLEGIMEVKFRDVVMPGPEEEQPAIKIKARFTQFHNGGHIYLYFDKRTIDMCTSTGDWWGLYDWLRREIEVRWKALLTREAVG